MHVFVIKKNNFWARLIKNPSARFPPRKILSVNLRLLAAVTSFKKLEKFHACIFRKT